MLNVRLFLLATCVASLLPAQTPWAERLSLVERHRVDAITQRRFTHGQYWRAIDPSVRSGAFVVEEAGRSMQGRELRTLTFGRGTTKVFMWSQMHGDEATATMALADIFAFLSSPTPHALRDILSRELTITFLPMLNPDGAEIFQRENAAGIDINRDVRRMASPEARTLKAVRDRIVPDFGFNLHDQNARTRVGTGEQAAIALLPPASDSARSYGPVRSRARLVAAWLARDFATVMQGRIAKYDDTFNPRAFGDLMQTWGASTLLIESGALPNDPQKQQLRMYNGAAMLGVLEAIALRAYDGADPGDYERLPFNRGGAYDLLITGGTVVIPGVGTSRNDIAVNFDESLMKVSGRIREMGDLEGAVGLDTLRLDGLFLHPDPDALLMTGGTRWLPLGAPARFTVRASADPASPVIRRVP